MHASSLRRLWSLLALLPLLGLAVPALAADTGLQFNGTNQAVTFGRAPGLGARTFTIETWFIRTATGVACSTGTKGMNAVPLVTKGRAQADGDVRDMNYFLGIRNVTNVLCADFEEGASGVGPDTLGLNHPVFGVTPIRNNVWYHAAATWDGFSWRLYLNGALEVQWTLPTKHLPRWDSAQHAGLATAMDSSGTRDGYFAGVLDEVRIWDHARPQQGIADSMLLEITDAPGLLGRWGLDEGTGTAANNSVPGGVNGALVNGPLWVTGSPFAIPPAALRLGSSNAHVALGNPAALGLAQFTLECWFRRDGSGVTTSTGTGGVTALPLVTKGRAEQDASNVDMNYFLGIRGADSVLVADFEEGAAGATPGLNHPVIGTTPVTRGTWHHAAATYDGTTWRLYLDGVIDGQATVGQPPRFDSIQHAGLGTAFNSTGVAAGYFNGTLDEVRIWNYARTTAGLDSTVNEQIALPRDGLVARWGLDEAAASTVYSTAGTALNGTITGTGWSWTGPAPFDLVVTPPTVPAAPTNLAASAVSIVQVHLGWTDNSGNELHFEIERSTSGSGGPFLPLVTLPAGTTSYDDLTVQAATEYCYRVRATNLVGPSGWDGPACATTPVETNHALSFGGTNGYVTFGEPAALHLFQFTIECWFRRDGSGITTQTGTGGITGALPIITKGRHEQDGDVRDMNFFLGIRDADDVIAADFEEGTAGPTPGLNHPVYGVTPIVNGVWHHAAATYDGGSWRLYLDGNLERELYLGVPPQGNSAQHACLATAMDTSGVAEGFFQGVVDEARVWDHARSQQEIQEAINSQIAAAQTGLVARWSLNEGAGSAVHGSAGTTVNGTVVGSDWSWVDGAPFDLHVNHTPGAPSLIAPAHLATGVSRSAKLSVQVTDADADPLTVKFYGRPYGAGTGADFSIIVLPDMQFYTSNTSGATTAMFRTMTQWIASHRDSLNVRYVTQTGDMSNNGDSDMTQWTNAASAMYTLEDAIRPDLPHGIPYDVSVGNHDETPIGDPNGTTTGFNNTFGIANFQTFNYYGGHRTSNFDDHFMKFSASGLDFILISLKYSPAPPANVLDWADSLLKAYPTRRGIVVHHNIIGTGNPASFDTDGLAIYDALKDNPNLFLMLCGHTTGEGLRQDTWQDNTVHSMLVDYQSWPNGGSGWFKILTFSPANNEIRVQTYSPLLDSLKTGALAQFTLDYAMGAPFALIGTNTNVPAGSITTVTWPGLGSTTEYEWYATVADSVATVTGPHWRFTTGTAITGVDLGVPTRLTFEAARPNPVVTGTTFAYGLPQAGHVRLGVFDLSGRRVVTLVDAPQPAGRHTLQWRARDAAGAALPSGAYFARLEFAGRSEVRKIVVMR